MPPPSPTVTAWELGIRLREARDTAALTAVEAGKRLNMSQNFLSDLEHGKRKVTEAKLEAMVEVYAIDADEAAELRAMLEQSARRGWWSKYSGIFPAEVLRYFGYEHGAESVQTHESLLIPGLLQTEAYAYAIVTSDGPNIRTSEADQRVEVRMRRQQRLTGDDPLRLTAVLSEGALRQQVGGREVMVEQLRHLTEVIEEKPDTLEVLVVPFSAGAHGALGASTFHILHFANSRLPRVAWQEAVTSATVMEHRPRVGQFSATFAESVKQTAGREGSLDLIHREIKALR
ncbi:helix-turn-helix domain-containing protein [Saccharopolyspora sp. HNM0986]|uniref:helix-turn-helix domain-containing protein n=1 Tax=Saccharopolyspora galaxeae TaxID=2781241 RepID=UPI00190A89F5|nr:helix-turn-helix transcriptional regulator [Saccharopolyspora sp. HNM0986]MBK0868638.1 helix-turn-helix domain-containing protein [Saccharopolyspora sp. HNM0986]